MNKVLVVLVFGLACLSCSKEISKPSFIAFTIENDSLIVIAKNKYHCPLSIKAEHRTTGDTIYKYVPAKGHLPLFKLNREEDSISVLKTYRFSGQYGDVSKTSYDTSYNYSLPFTKGYSSKIIQGYDGEYSHKGAFSAKSLDFGMNVGDTILAARDGIVIKKVVHHNKQGTTKAFRDFGNYIMIYHEDNTFSQYVHLKQYGNLVDVGDSVRANQPIALSGFTGWTTIPHLHFGVYKPTKSGLVSIPIILDSIPASTLKRGDIVIKD